MEIKEVQSKKHKLENEISELLYEFSKETNCQILNLYLDKLKVSTFGNYSDLVYGYSVKIEVVV